MKEYLGDGAYVQPWTGGGLLLTTEDGIRTTNSIVLEPEVLEALLDYITRQKAKARGESDAAD